MASSDKATRLHPASFYCPYLQAPGRILSVLVLSLLSGEADDIFPPDFLEKFFVPSIKLSNRKISLYLFCFREPICHRTHFSLFLRALEEFSEVKPHIHSFHRNFTGGSLLSSSVRNWMVHACGHACVRVGVLVSSVVFLSFSFCWESSPLSLLRDFGTWMAQVSINLSLTTKDIGCKAWACGGLCFATSRMRFANTVRRCSTRAQRGCLGGYSAVAGARRGVSTRAGPEGLG